MPIPKRRKNESKKEFISRCMGDKIMVKDFPDQKQRSAVCYSQLKKNEEDSMLSRIDFLLMNYETRVEFLEGKNYLVAPVVMLKEGVHNGSSGAYYYPPDEIAKSTVLWNGVPVTLPHPHTLDGKAISANSPEAIAEFKVGRVWNAHWDKDNEALKAEVWVDIDKLEQMQATELTDAIKNQKQIDVSTGLFSEEDGKEGTWNDEDFVGTVSDFKPDHLALLPNTSGACSWEDGCGIRHNFSNKVGLDQTMSAVYRAVDGMRTKNTNYYVLEVFKDFVVYERYGMGSKEPAKLYKQPYTINKDDEVTLTGEPVQVKREVKYVSVKTNATQNKEEKTMGNNDEKCCPEKVQLLIENEATKYEETDREWLETLTEEQIDKMLPEVKANEDDDIHVKSSSEDIKAAAESGAGEEEDTDGTPIKDIVKENQQADDDQTAEQYIQNAPDGIRDMLSDGLAMHNQKKKDLIGGLLANKSNPYTEAELQNMDMKELRKLSQLAQTNNFSGRGGNVPDNDSEDQVEALSLPTMNWDK